MALGPTGLDIQTEPEIRDSVEAELRDAFGSSVPLGDSTLLGKLVGIWSSRYASLWELMEVVAGALDPDAATEAQLDAIAALTGTLRLPAQPSTVTLTLTGTPTTTTVTAGSQVSVDSTSERFEVQENSTIAVVPAWAATTAYALGDRVTNSGNVYECSLAGTSAGSGGPSGTGTGEVDGTAEWDFLGAGTGAVDAEANSVNTGPIVAVARDITTIESPISGWDGVINVEAAELGNDVETDEELRARRLLELQSAGTGTLGAIRSALLDVDNVTAVRVFQNITDVTDADGVPPHAVEALVSGGADQDIFDALLANVAAGIRTHGTTTGTSTDDEGIAQAMAFTRPTDINIYVDVTLVKDPSVYPSNGDTLVADAIVEAANTTGLDVVASRISSLVFTVPGVLDVTSVFIDTSPSPATSTTIPIALRELADYDAARITVDSSASGVP